MSWSGQADLEVEAFPDWVDVRRQGVSFALDAPSALLLTLAVPDEVRSMYSGHSMRGCSTLLKYMGWRAVWCEEDMCYDSINYATVYGIVVMPDS